jgi:hypothetical protein
VPGVSATEGERALTEQVQRQRGNGRLEGSEGSESFDQDRTEGVRGGSEGSKSFDQDQTGEIGPEWMSGCE